MRRRWVLGVGLLLAGACARTEPPFDFDAACDTADAPAATVSDLRQISATINDASNGSYQPKGKDVERWSAAIAVGEAARQAAAPYAVPSEFLGNLPVAPDTSKVTAAQQRLRAACEG